MRRYLVAGGDGFIGRHLVRHLLERDRKCHVIVVDRRFGPHPSVAHGSRRLRRITGDICSLNVSPLPRVDVIFHLASLANPRLFEEYALDILHANSIGTINLIRLAERDSARLIYASSSEVYGHFNPGRPLRESDPGLVYLGTGRSVYANSKRFGEELIVTARRRGVDAVSVRLFNVYGTGLDDGCASGRVVHSFVDAALQGKPLRIFGDGLQLRSFLWIDDAIRALILLAESPPPLPPALNIGRDEPVSISDLSRKVIRTTRSASSSRFEPLPPDEPAWRRPNTRSMERTTGWSGSTPLAQGLFLLASCQDIEHEGSSPIRPHHEVTAQELKGARRLIARNRVREALRGLDRFTELHPGEGEFWFLRALARELVNDLMGARADLAGVVETPETLTVMARVYAKLGFGDQAAGTLRTRLRDSSFTQMTDTHGIPYAVGVIGRRFDLEVLGDGAAMPVRLDDEVRVRIVAEHLLSLGEFDACMKCLEENGNRFARNLSDLCRRMSEADALGHPYGDSERRRVEKYVRRVRGWLSFDEATVLASLAAEVPADQSVVEIGSFIGRSTMALGVGCRTGAGATVHSVDPHKGLAGIHPHETLDEFMTTVRRASMEDFVRAHVAESVRVAARWRGSPVGLLFIDGRHDSRSVKRDFAAWERHLAPDGLVAFHDSLQSGPNETLRRIITGPHKLSALGIRDSIFVLRKDDSARRHARLWVGYLSDRGHRYQRWVEYDRDRVRAQALRIIDARLGPKKIGNRVSG